MRVGDSCALEISKVEGGGWRFRVLDLYTPPRPPPPAPPTSLLEGGGAEAVKGVVLVSPLP